MIFIRRVLAVILGLVFFLVFTLGILRSHVANTLFDAGYVSRWLETLDIYNWLDDSVLPAVVADGVTTGVDVNGDFLPGDATTIEFANRENTQRTVLNVVRDTFPPEYLQSVTEGFLEGVLPYVQGEREDFAIPIDLNGRVRAFFPAAHRAVTDLGLSETLVEELVAPAAERSAEDFTLGPLGVALTGEQARDAARRVAPPEWIDEQVFAAMDQAQAYLSGQSDHLAIQIPLADRVPIAATVVKDILAKGDADQLLFDRVVLPRIREQIGSVTVLSYNVPITDAEINDAVRQIAPRSWVQHHVNGIVDAAAAYLSRETDDLTYTVDMRERKRAAIGIVGDLAVRKARERISAIPRCATRADLATAGVAIQRGVVPRCLPSQGADALLGNAVERVRRDVAAQIGARFPDTMQYGLGDFSAGLAGRGATDLQEVRNTIHDGITYTEQDLRAEFAGDAGTFDRWLDVARSGRPYTSADFEKDFMESNPEEFDNFDRARGYMGLALGGEGGALMLGIGFILAAAIGLLGGRMWPTRLAWAAGAVTFSALIVFVVAGQIVPDMGRDYVQNDVIAGIENNVYGHSIDAEIAQRQLAGEPYQRLIVFRDEGVPKALDWTESWFAGIGDAALLWLFVGLLGMAVGWAWWYYTRPQRVGYR